MAKHFYNHITSMDAFRVTLEDLELTIEEKEELLSIAEKNIHHTVLDVVLMELTGEDKKAFLLHVVAGDHERVWQLLAQKMPKAEEKIKVAVKNVTKKLHDDIHEVQKK